MDDGQLIRIANCCNALTTRYSYLRNGRGSHMMPLAELASMFMDTYPNETEWMEMEGTNLRATLDLILERDILGGTWSFILERRNYIEDHDFWSALLDDPDDYDPRTYFFCVYPVPKTQRRQEERQLQQLAEEEREQAYLRAAADPLDEEAEAIYQDLLPTGDIEYNHEKLKDELNMMVSRVWWPEEGYYVDDFGSKANGLLLDNSDADLTIVLPDFQEQHAWCAVELDTVRKRNFAPSIFDMELLAQNLQSIGMEQVKVIHAKVPICKFYDPQTNIQGDLCVQNTLAVENSKLIKAYTRVDPRVRPFMYIVKHFAKRRNINDSTRGTFSSYSYNLMCIYYLMKLNNPVVPNLQHMACSSPACKEKMNLDRQVFLYNNEPVYLDVFYHDCINSEHSSYDTPWESNNNDSLSTLLIGFFEFYANVDTDHLILLNNRTRRTPKPKSYTLTVVDPFLESKNVTAASTRIGWDTIQHEFYRAASILNDGGSFEQVLEENQEVYYDPDCISYRYGFT